MDTSALIASIVESLAWPIAIIVLVLILRGPIARLIPLIEKLKYKDVEIEFGRKLAAAKAEAEVSDIADSSDAEPEHEYEIEELAKVSPRAAVSEAWRWVEMASLSTAERVLGKRPTNYIAAFRAIRRLEREEHISVPVYRLMRELRELRNKAVHAPEFAISIDTAMEYADTARWVASRLGNISNATQRSEPTEPRS